VRGLDLEPGSSGNRGELLTEEMSPILIDLYRNVLGRDPSTDEINARVNARITEEFLDVPAIQAELMGSQERIDRENQKANIINQVESQLIAYLALDNDTDRQTFLDSLALDLAETVSLAQVDVDQIVSWLRSRDLHFGQSAFGALQEMLRNQMGCSLTDLCAGLASIELLGEEAILIDILTGSIHRFTEGDLLISVLALNRTARVHTHDFAGVFYTFDELLALYQSNPNLRVIAHIGGDHYVIVTNVTADEVTYREVLKGLDGEEQTISKDHFLKAWTESNTTLDSGYLIVPLNLAQTEAIISDAQAKKVKGAFLPFIIWFFFAASVVLSVASVVVSFFSPTLGKILGIAALITGIIGIVASVGNLVVSGVKHVFASIAQQGFLKSITNGFKALGQLLYQGVRSVGRFVVKSFQFLKDGFSNGLARFGSGITNLKSFLLNGAGQAGSFTTQQVIARNLVAAGLNYDYSKGFGGFNLNFVMNTLSGSFVGSNSTGIGTQGSNFLRTGLKNLLLQGASIIGLHLDLPPPISTALGTLAFTGLTDFFDPTSGGLFSSLPDILPDITEQLTLGGFDLLGRSLGLDPRITSLIGLPIRASIGTLTKGLLNPNGGGGPPLWEQVVDSFQRGAIAGATGFAIDFVSDELDINPLFSALAVRVGAAGVTGAINPNQTIFSAMSKAFTDSLKRLNPFSGVDTNDPNSWDHYFSRSLEFSRIVQNAGSLFGGLNAYATTIFTRDAVESMISQGGLLDILTDKAEFTDVNDVPVKAIHIDVNNDLYLSPTDDSIILGRRMGNNTELGTFVVGPDGKFLLKDGVVETVLPDGVTMVLEVNNGQANGYRVSIDDETLLQMYSTGGNQIALNPDGTIHSGILVNEVTGARIEMKDGKLLSFSMTAPDVGSIALDGMSLDQLTDLQKQGLVLFATSNGIWNRNPEGVPPQYEADLMNSLIQKGVDPASILAIPLYEEGNIPKDTFSWIADALGSDEITNEIITKMDQKWITLSDQQKAQGLTSVLYSGSVNPFLKAVERRDYNISTIVSLGGPTIEGTLYEGHIDNQNVQRFINIYGEQDLVPLAGPLLGGNKSFDNVNTINIKILNTGHGDYFPAPDRSNKVGEFIAKIIERANDQIALTGLLQQFNQLQDGTYEIDPDVLPDES
jgi:hypothetical protein